MMRTQPRQSSQDNLPIDIVGSNNFGRYNKISDEQTFNMIISQDWLVPFAGYVKAASSSLGKEGRAIYSSVKKNIMILVIDNFIYQVNNGIGIEKINQINTITGDVFISENNANQIAICDKQHIYIYNYVTGDFTIPVINFAPSYITFQDTYFIATVIDPNTNKGYWRLSDNNDGTSWPTTAGFVGEFQTKPDSAIGAIRVPGKGNMLLLFGNTVTELWNDVGLPLFPYQKNTSYNLDYGCLSSATIAGLENYVVWLGGNEQAGATIMYTDGGAVKQISTDGINFKLAHLQHPSDSVGFLYRQDGHVIYVITFYSDNLTYAYDFNTQRFFTLTDPNLNYFIARKVVLFNEEYYFVSLNDGYLYRLSSLIPTYDNLEIPRIRITKPVRMPADSRFIINNLTFTVEQGDSNTIQRVDLSLSKDGGSSFSSVVSKTYNSIGHRPNRLNWWNLGSCNDLTVQLRFWGKSRFMASNGILSVYQ